MSTVEKHVVKKDKVKIKKIKKPAMTVDRPVVNVRSQEYENSDNCWSTQQSSVLTIVLYPYLQHLTRMLSLLIIKDLCVIGNSCDIFWTRSNCNHCQEDEVILLNVYKMTFVTLVLCFLLCK